MKLTDEEEWRAIQKAEKRGRLGGIFQSGLMVSAAASTILPRIYATVYSCYDFNVNSHLLYMHAIITLMRS